MSGRRHILLVFFGLCCLPSCKEKEEFTPLECKYFIAETAPCREIGFDELYNTIVKKYKDQGINTEEILAPYSEDLQKLRLASRNFTAFTISYRTIDPEEKPVTASGMIYFPFSKHLDGVIEVCPGNENKEDCASKSIFLDELLCGTTGYLCLVPDLMGCGSTESRPMAYLQNDNKARMSADLRRAAREFVYNKYHEDILNAETYILGYGLGGAHALSLARLYEENSEYGVKVNEVDAGGGFYDLPTVLDELCNGGEHDTHLLHGMLRSAVEYNGLELDLGTVSDPEVFSPGKAAYNAARDVFASLSLESDWIPECKVIMMHSMEDELAPVKNADNFVKKWEKAGAKPEYSRLDSPREAVFFKGGGEFIRRIIINE